MTMKNVFTNFFFFTCAIHSTDALPTFRDLIPNGHSVPNPGPQGGVWAGVGHYAAGGGGPRNPFGLDFAAGGFTWNEDLCRKDSDGDGRTNGEELGDPDCVWFMGDPTAFPATSHPGIPDEPISHIPTDPCALYDPPADTQAMNIVFSSPNTLDGTRTQYICEQKAFTAPDPSVSEYHQIKSQILHGSANDVLHHIWIYTCDGGVVSSDGNKVGQGSYSCSGIEGNCAIVAGWALGGTDFCEPPNIGAFINFGTNKELVFKIEAHYDNAAGAAVQDQSGMRIHLTPTLRPIDNSMVIVGMDFTDRQFIIPEGQPSYSLTNICPSSATRRLQHPVWVYSWNPHMHNYGTSLVTEHYRCGVKIGEIGRINAFEFDYQQTYFFRQYIKILPGDALVTTCTYDSTRGNPTSPILGGEETTDEMCDNYLTYYPYSGTNAEPDLFTACLSFARGENPAYAGYNDFTPFVTLDLAGNTVIWPFNDDPTQDLPDCCNGQDNGATCEAQYLSGLGGSCAIDSDCLGSFQCKDGFCIEPENIQPPAQQPDKQNDKMVGVSSTSKFPNNWVP